MQVVKDTAPGSKSERHLFAGWIPGWRFGLKSGERCDRAAFSADCPKGGSIFLTFEEHAPIAHRGGSVGVAGEVCALDSLRRSLDRCDWDRPKVQGAARIGTAVVNQLPIRGERDWSVSLRSGRRGGLAARQ